jgi:hypothetical protein
MSPRLRAAVWAASCSAAVLGVGLCLPLWERTRISECCLTREMVPLGGLAESDQVSLLRLGRRFDHNGITCLTLLSVAGGVGALVYWVRRPRTRPLEAGDYADGPAGSMPDGRALPG